VTDFLQFAILGLGLGAIYALIAQGVVLIYRGSGVVNFAQGAFAMAGAYTYFELQQAGAGFGAALLAAIALGVAMGVLTQLLVMRPLRNAAPITRIIATLGIFIALQAGAALKYGDSLNFVNQFLPQRLWVVAGIKIQSDRLELLAIAIVLTIALEIAKRRSLIGLATSAAAESERGASTLGWSPNLLATLNWALGGALAGMAGALIAPLAGLLVNNLTLLIVPALAAALLGRFDSFTLTLVGAVGIGILQSLCIRYSEDWLGSKGTGVQDSIPFIVIILVLVVTGRSLPLRSHVGERLPSIGSGRLRWMWVIGLPVALGLAFTEILNPQRINWINAFTVSMIIAIILLSIVVVTGYAGQISLAQYAFAGLGAWVAGRLVAAEGWPFWAALLAGLAASIPIGVAFGLPALRTRGVNLAVVTLGLALVAQRMIFENVDYTGGNIGTVVGFTHLFGLDVNAIIYPDRYALVVLTALVLVIVMVGNLRRSAAGRRLIAIRGNERAAASLGISVVGGKLYAFSLGAAIASLGGILLGFRGTNIIYENFGAVQSIYAIAWAVIGGIGFLLGPLLGSGFVGGGTGSLINDLLSGIDRWLVLISGAFVVWILLFNPDGLVPAHIRQGQWFSRTFAPIGRPFRGIRARAEAAFTWLPAPLRTRGATRRKQRLEQVLRTAREAPRARVEPQQLWVRDLSIRYGGVVAVDSVSLEVAPGEIVGLIGPNGAGKTSLIDAITGFTAPSSGQVLIGDLDLTRLPAHKRVHEGLVRSWQSLELFEEVSVLENLQIACERRTWVDNLTGLVWPGQATLTPVAAAAVHEFREFRLEDELERRVTELSFSQRRVVSTARAVSHAPSILLLDEPTAGMSDVRRAELSRAVRRLAQDWGIGLLVVDHDMPFVLDICDRIVVMDAGRKIADGTPDEVRNDPLVIAAYLRTETEEAAAEAAEAEAAAEAVGDGAPRIRIAALGPARAEKPRVGAPLLAARDLSVGYYGHPVLQGLDFEVYPGEVVALLGANRAGKTTTLLGLAGEIRPLAGEVEWLGERVSKRVPLHKRAAQGLGFVTDERSVFMRLTVAENLRVGRCDEEWAMTLFPELRKLLKRRAGLLSGGEQQMLGLGRALARNPKVLLVDEMSLGLAPIIVSRLLDALRQAADERNVGIVLVEQHVQQALAMSDRVCVIAGGRMTLEGSVAEVGHRVADAFLADVLGTVEEAAAVPDVFTSHEEELVEDPTGR
jgi:sulfate-transporting ATPase